MLEAALELAARGFRVFPVHTTAGGKCSCGRDCGKDASKHPRIREWQKHATSDAGQVGRWWRKWPDANVGLAAGLQDSGLWLCVLDLDGDGEAQAFAAIAKPHGGLPHTLTAATGRGWHVYLEAEFPTTRKVDGLLVRGTGGYVIAPPSWHASGKRYAWLDQRPIAKAPQWFVNWLQQAPGNTKLTVSGSGLIGGGAQTDLPLHLIKRKQQLEAAPSKGILSRSLKTFMDPWTAHEEARVRSALSAIPADCGRDEWLHLGMALHGLGWERSDGTDAGFDIWLEWSRTGKAKFASDFDCETRWKSFGRRGGVGLGTLFHKAEQAGWKGVVSPQTAAPVAQGEGIGNHNRVNGRTVNGSVFANPQVFDSSDAIVFPDTDKKGNPQPTCVNTRKALEGLGLSCRYDTFHERFTIGGRILQQWAGEVADATVQMLRVMIHNRYGFDPPTVTTHDAVTQECLLVPHNPVLDYLNRLRWDGVKRVDTWLSQYLGATDSVLTRQIGRLTLVAAVRRVCVPGTKFDQIVVLEGIEGRNKSTAIQTLAGADSFSDQSILTLDDRAQQEAMAGVWLYEIADLAGIGRADVERVKAFASRSVDRARPAYGRSRVDKPRRCVFFATTNDSNYLQSQTGNRRFWPIQTGHIDLGALRQDRDQLWAEAVELEHSAKSLFLPEPLWEAARVEQEARRAVDPWEGVLASVVGKEFEGTNGKEFRITTRDMLDLQLRLNIERQTPAALKRASQIMQRLGWERIKLWENGQTVSGYRKTGKRGNLGCGKTLVVPTT